MPLPESCRLSPLKEKKLKLAAACRCERCSESYPARLLELHFVSGKSGCRGSPPRDLQKHLLVVCPVCHHEIHELPVPYSEQKELAGGRPVAMKRAMRSILHYVPKLYTSPDDYDYAQVFAETCPAGRDIFVDGT